MQRKNARESAVVGPARQGPGRRRWAAARQVMRGAPDPAQSLLIKGTFWSLDRTELKLQVQGVCHRVLVEWSDPCRLGCRSISNQP